MGSLLEGAVLYKVEQNRATASRATRAPRNRDQSLRPIHQWGLSALIDVAHEVQWLEGGRAPIQSRTAGVTQHRASVRPATARRPSRRRHLCHRLAGRSGSRCRSSRDRLTPDDSRCASPRSVSLPANPMPCTPGGFQPCTRGPVASSGASASGSNRVEPLRTMTSTHGRCRHVADLPSQPSRARMMFRAALAACAGTSHP